MRALRRPRTSDPQAERSAALTLVRSTGAQGGRIDPHRSIATIDLHARDVMLAAALAVVAMALYGVALPYLGRAWTQVFAWLATPLGLSGQIGGRVTSLGPFIRFGAPHFAPVARAPGPLAWWITLIVTVLAFAATLPMRAAWLPFAYAVRFAAVIQSTALLYFAVAARHFPYDLAGYVSGMMLVGAMLIGIVPLVLGLTYYLIDVGWSRKVALTLLVMGHLAVMIPLQYALQAAIIVHASLIVLPLCFVMFGLLPEIMVLVALFGWGMSWAPTGARGSRQ